MPFSFKKRAATNIIDMLTGDNTIDKEINEDEKKIIIRFGLTALDEIKREALNYSGGETFVTNEGLCKALGQCSNIFLIAIGEEYDYKCVCDKDKDIDTAYKIYFGIEPPKRDVIQLG